MNSVSCFRKSAKHSEGYFSGHPDSQHQSPGQLFHWLICFNADNHHGQSVLMLTIIMVNQV